MAQDNDVLVALPLRNLANVPADKVQITSLTVSDTSGDQQTSNLGNLAPDTEGMIFAKFPASVLSDGKTRIIKLEGNYSEGNVVHKFVLQQSLAIPSQGSGNASAASSSAAANTASGAVFPHAGAHVPSETNADRSWLPPKAAANPPAPTSKESTVLPAPGPGTHGINFRINAPLAVAASAVNEPSGATGGGILFMTANWFGAYSTDAGAHFHTLDPTTIFPNNVDAGFCCDQIVAYAPSIDRFLWLMQYGQGSTGESRYRLAAASPSDVKSSGGTIWKYWDITSTQIGFPKEFLDYPDMSVGSNFVYASFDQVNSGGRVIVRIPLSDIQSGSTINFRYTHNADSPMAYGGHLSQNTRDEIFWAGHNSNNSMRIFSWQESSTSYFWRDVNVATWPNDNTTMISLAPDGQDWLTKLRGFPGNAILGATRAFGTAAHPVNQIWFAWSAPGGGSFNQPHVQWVVVDRDHNFSVISQQQIWNANYAFAYPALASNSNGEIGISLEFGGGGNYENHAVGFLGDFTVYKTTNSAVGYNRFGDYVTIHQNPASPAQFDAFGYGLLKATPPGTDPTPDTRYVLFSR